MAYRKRLLVLDDEPDIGEFVRDVAIESGYDALASDSPEAFPSVYTNDIDVVVLDIPFSEMKIDRSFVMNALSDDEALAIVKITIMLGHELGMKVVAEGIENQQPWDLLSSLGCDAAQGYFSARPMPSEEVLTWARTHSAST